MNELFLELKKLFSHKVVYQKNSKAWLEEIVYKKGDVCVFITYGKIKDDYENVDKSRYNLWVQNNEEGEGATLTNKGTKEDAIMLLKFLNKLK